MSQAKFVSVIVFQKSQTPNSTKLDLKGPLVNPRGK